jgi:hypothetical protein
MFLYYVFILGFLYYVFILGFVDLLCLSAFISHIIVAVLVRITINLTHVRCIFKTQINIKTWSTIHLSLMVIRVLPTISVTSLEFV